jgi:O-antigen/teichoic acid export membrane protein
MGIIRNQSIKNSISLYIGVAIGAINTILIFPHVFENNPEYWGLLQILVSYSIIFSSFSHLGSPSILLRFFPKINSKGDLISFSLILCAIGFALFFLLFYVFKEYLLSYLGASLLLVDNFYLVGVLVFCITYFEVFSSLSRSYFDSATPVFLNEVFLRICILILLIIYKYEYISFNDFLLSYVSFYIIKLVILVFLQWRKNRLTFSKNRNTSSFKEQIKYGLYVLTGGGTAILVSRFDILMIEYYLDLKQVAYYGLAFFIGSVIKIPARSISSISTPLIAKAFENNDLLEINTIYRKTSINLLIIGGVIFLCVSLNVDDILSLLPPKFSHGKFVILIIGCAQLFPLLAGLQGSILINSPYYKSIIYFNLLLFITTVITNFLFIPLYGINGAALASLISIAFLNFARVLYVHKKLNMHPFSNITFLVIIIIISMYFGFGMIPFFDHPIINIFLRSLAVCLFFLFLILKFKLSDDLIKFISPVINKLPWTKIP